MWQNSILYRIISVSPKAVIASSQQEHPASVFLLSYTLALLTNGSLLLRYTQVCKFKYILWYLCSLNMTKTFWIMASLNLLLIPLQFPQVYFLYDSLYYGLEKVENSDVCYVFPLVIAFLFRKEIKFVLKMNMCNEYEFLSLK